jgi:hypothetical protein
MLAFLIVRMTNTTTKKFNTFLSRPLQDSVLGDIPGVGKSSLVKLLSMHMDTPEKLMGLYMVSSRDPEKMKCWLMSNCAIRAQEAGKISEALDRKAHFSMMVC